MTDSQLIFEVLGLLLPLGLILIASSSLDREAPRTALWGLLALPLAMIAFALFGFGIQFGGLGLVSTLAGAEGLIREWSPLDIVRGPGWGLIGLSGFFALSGNFTGEILALLLHQSILLATAIAIPLTVLARKAKGIPLIFVALIAALAYPLFGNWVWGGGWLSQLGKTGALGHGFVDYAGSGAVYTLGGLLALAGIIAFSLRQEGRKGPIAPPPVHLPLLAVLGIFLFALGSIALALGNPLIEVELSSSLIVLNTLLAASAGVLLTALYSGLVRGDLDPFLIIRGGIAGLVAVSASSPFVPPWAALVTGTIAGLLLPITVYLVETRLRLDNAIDVTGTFVLPGLWGLLALGLCADGRNGAGWNGIEVSSYLGIEGQGVSGYLVAPGFQPSLGQLQAQVVGLVALLILFGLSFLALRGLARLLGSPTKPETQAGKGQRQASSRGE